MKKFVGMAGDGAAPTKKIVPLLQTFSVVVKYTTRIYKAIN